MRHCLTFALLGSCSVLATSAQALPGASPWMGDDVAAVRIVSATDSAGALETLQLGLQFRLAEDWKIYWRHPGDAGFPPVLDSAGSENLDALVLRWPAPRQFIEPGDLISRGYTDTVILPMDVTRQHPDRALRLRLHVAYQVCKTVCIPVDADLALDLGTDGPTPGAFAQEIASHVARVPTSPGEAGIKSLGAYREGPGRIVVTATGRLPFGDEAENALAFVQAGQGFGFRSGTVERSSDGRTLRVHVEVLPPDTDHALEADELDLTLVAGARAVEDFVRLGEPPERTGLSLPIVLLLALAGGLILNLMPCVLPVLALKVASVLDNVDGEPGQVARSFLATVSGMVASFLVLALIVIGLRETGRAVGWGFQFHEPAFLGLLSLVTLLFAANLAGAFELALPARLGGILHRTGQGAFRPFAEGAFATLLATPCTAPVLGTAVGFALARGPVEILTVFLGLGFGMGLPWLLLAARPQALRLLPRPGKWMEWLRRLLAIPLFATLIWLLFLLRNVGGDGVVLLVLLCGAGSVVLLALRARSRRPGALLAGAVTLSILATVGPDRFDPPSAVAPTDGDSAWTPLEPESLETLAREQIVLVDITADWCVTCVVNKRLVLDRTDVRDAFAEDDVLLVRGDWTLPNPVISTYLATFGRYGIPFNVIYGPGSPAGDVLPTLLTVDAVLSGLARAAGSGNR